MHQTYHGNPESAILWTSKRTQEFDDRLLIIAVQTPKTLLGLLRFPAISAKDIAFVYANKLWLAPRTGGTALPLATPPGHVMLPKFSADGATRRAA